MKPGRAPERRGMTPDELTTLLARDGWAIDGVSVFDDEWWVWQ